ncbi:MAG: PKD domain-containing protein [Bacteroidota bacterium]|nr:PKD domain-containing protein [Bacteroidota bacterium]
MKKITILLLTLLPLGLLAQTKTALFLGNSYTYSNGGIPDMLSEIASSLEDTLVFDDNLMGGATLNDHSENATSLSKIASQTWDYVVLQEQSQMPSFPQSEVETMVYPFAEILCDSIFANDSCTIPMFFMTWGRENGDQNNCEYYEPLCTYEGMQLELRKSYLKMAVDNEGSAAPVGMVWKAIREDYPDIDLYSSDESHPSLAGTFLASNVFYTAMFHNSPVGGYIPDGISTADALHMQEYAANIILDSLDVWMIDTTHVSAFFIPDFPVGKNTIGWFMNESENAEWFAWDFGDGSDILYQTEYTETQHVFLEEGEYTVCLTAWKDCESDIYCQSVHTDIFQSDVLFDLEENVIMNGESLHFPQSMLGERVWIYDSQGRLLDTKKIRQYEMNLSVYSGLLFVKHSCGTTKILLN